MFSKTLLGFLVCDANVVFIIFYALQKIDGMHTRQYIKNPEHRPSFLIWSG